MSGNEKLIYMNFPPWSNLTIYSVLGNFQFLAWKPSCSLFWISWPAVKLAFRVFYSIPWLGHGNSQLDQTSIWKIWNLHCPFYFMVLEGIMKHWLLNLFIYLFLAVLGLHFCVRAFSSCGKRGPLFIAVHGPLTIAASLVEEHGLQTRRLSSCGSRA